MLVGVPKEIKTEEYRMGLTPASVRELIENQILFTYLHLAPAPQLTKALVDSGCVAIAYETVTDELGGLPLLAPMSEVAGRMAAQVGAHCLEKPRGGAGILLGGVPGVEAAQVVILAGGVAGTVNGIVHYCVANMPAAVPRTSTFALNNATLPFTLALANRGYRAALSEDFHLRNGLNVHRGRITCEAVAQELQYDYQPASEAIGT